MKDAIAALQEDARFGRQLPQVEISLTCKQRRELVKTARAIRWSVNS